jgi:hypothetical protein
MAAAETRNSRASRGRSGCGAKIVTNAQNPANTTAAVRVVECVACETISSIMRAGEQNYLVRTRAAEIRNEPILRPIS